MAPREQNLPTAIILAGGLGTRLRSAVSDRPKVLAMVNGRPFLTLLLDQLVHFGFRDVVLSIGYRGEQVYEAIGTTYRDLAITYSREECPLGTGGAVQAAAIGITGEEVLVLNGDSFADVDLHRMLQFARSNGLSKVLTAISVPDCARFGTVEMDSLGRLERFREKSGESRPGWINAGIYLLPRRALAALAASPPFSLEYDVFPDWGGRDFGVYAQEAKFIDIGTPQSFEEAQAFFASRTKS